MAENESADVKFEDGPENDTDTAVALYELKLLYSRYNNSGGLSSCCLPRESMIMNYGNMFQSTDKGRNMTVHIKLYGDKGKRFEEIKTSMKNEWGYEPTNPEVIGHLMATYDRPLTNQVQ